MIMIWFCFVNEWNTADVSNQIKKSGGKQLHPANSLGMPEKYINAEEIMKIDAEFKAKVKKQREKLNKIKLFLVFFQNKWQKREK